MRTCGVLLIIEPAERETRRASYAETCTQMRPPLPPVPPAMQMRPPRNHFGDPEKGSHCDIVAARHAWRQRHSYGKHTCFRLKRAAQQSVANHINLHSGFLFISSVFFHTELVSGWSKRGDDVTIGLALGSTFFEFIEILGVQVSNGAQI